MAKQEPKIRMNVRLGARLQFSKPVTDFEFAEKDGKVTLTCVTKPEPDPVVTPDPVTPDPVVDPEAPVADVTEGAVEEVTEVTEEATDGGSAEVGETVTEVADGGDSEFVGGELNPETGEITDPDTGETVGQVDLGTGEVTNTEGEVIGSVSAPEPGETVLDVVDEAGEVVGVVELPTDSGE